MISFKTKTYSAPALLAAAVVWFVSVTLCSTRTVAAQPAHDHDHSAAESPAGHSHDASHHDDKHDDGCGCESFNAFSPAQAAALAKAPTPADPFLLYTILPEVFCYQSAAAVVSVQSTGPPGRISPDKFILQRCMLNHAPPFVV
jgi:hypothetical protein